MNRRALLQAAVCSGVAGCSILPQRPYVEQRDWPLMASRPAVLPPNKRGKVVLLRTVRAAPGLEAQGLQSLRADGSVHTDYYERWSVPPPDAVEDQLRRWLAASGLFAGVLAPGSRARADLAVEAELLTLIAAPGIGAPGQGASRISLGLVVLDLRPAQPHLVLQTQATGSAALSGLAAPEIARSGQQALAALLGEVERALAAVLMGR